MRYPRAVTEPGNHKAQQILARSLNRPTPAGEVSVSSPRAGCASARPTPRYDAGRRFALKTADAPPPRGCACGEILTGQKTPPECALYKKVCTPMDPVGPCMVSSEGTCAAYYRYHYEA